MIRPQLSLLGPGLSGAWPSYLALARLSFVPVYPVLLGLCILSSLWSGLIGRMDLSEYNLGWELSLD